MTANAISGDLGDQLTLAVMHLYLRFRQERGEGDLGDKALEVLTRIAKSDGLTLTQLSAEDHIAPASMSDTINRLTNSGLAFRTADPADRRRMILAATPAGRGAVAAARASRHRWLDEQLAGFTDADRKAISHTCELFERMAES